MDWNLAIERNGAALKRIVAMLVAMAGLGEEAAFTSPLSGLRSRSSDRASGAIVGREGRGDCEAIGVPGKIREASGGGCGVAITPTRRSDDRRPPIKGEVDPALVLPRHLHRAILRLLRPAESAVRRLVIVMARGLMVTLAPPRPRKAKPNPTFLKKPGGAGIYLPPGARGRSGDTTARVLALPLLDPLRSPLSLSKGRPRRPAPKGVPRISLPGVTVLSAIAPRRPPAPDDPLDATRLALRLAALGAALDDLPGQAKRFARWRARRIASRDAAGTQNKNRDAAGTQNKNRKTGRTRRVWPLRPGRPPGQLRPNRRTHEVHEILHDLHGLAFDVLEEPDTS